MKTIQNNQPQAVSLTNECPNCWGRQSYCGVVYDNLPVGHIPATSLDKENFIRRFVIKNVEGAQRRLGILPNNR